MDDMIDVAIPLQPEVAKALTSQARREAVDRVLSGLFKGGRTTELLADVIADAKREARSKGLIDEDIAAELAAWRAESGA